MKPFQGKKLGLFSLFSMVFLTLVSGNFAVAQVGASLSGRIEDPSGAGIPGATVTATSLETGASRAVTTDEAGNYRVLSLPVGQYEVKAEKPGFKAQVQKGITLVVGQQAVVGLKMEVGDVQQEVTVTAEAPLVNTTTESVSGLVGEKQVKDLPLNGRSFDNLITLNTSAVDYTSKTAGGTSGGGQGNYFSVAGRRPLENLFLLNGVEYTGASGIQVTPGGVSGQLLGIDAVREFNVVSNTYSAEYGKRAGAQVSIVTQSGSNQLHGSAFEFLRNSKLDARNFFDHGPVPPFKRNQFGGALGGPIQEDKTFLFGNYEGFRQRLGLSRLTIVPDGNVRKGLLPNAQGTPTPVTGLDPRMLPYTAWWPEPNGANLGGGIALSYSNPAQAIREEFGTMRFDRTISNQDSLSGVYTIDDGDNSTPLADPLFGAVFSLLSQVFSLQETHIFTPQWINTLTVGFSRGAFAYDNPPLVPFPPNLSFITGRPPGSIGVGGGNTATAGGTITTAGPGNAPDTGEARTLFTYTDGLQVVRGSHQISAGVWFQRLRSNERGANQSYGNATFASLQTFLQGTVSSFQYPPLITPRAWRSFEGAWYLQDAIQLRPNLTLRLGLRHEFTNGWNEATGRSANFVTDSNGVLLTQTLTGDSALTKNNAKRLFSPRIGLAWDPFGKGRTSIRAGFGTYYTLLDYLGFNLKTVPPYNGPASFSNVSLFSITPISRAAPLAPSCGPGVPAPCTVYSPSGVQSDAKTPAVQSWSFTVEQQLGPSMALRVAYVGSHGVHDLVTSDINTIPPQICSNSGGCTSGGTGSARGTVPQGAEYIPVGTRRNPYLSNAAISMTEGSNSYNALQVEMTRRFGQGLQFRANYTWSKNLDIMSAIKASQGQNAPQTILNPYDVGRDWGPSAMNTKHQASGNFSYELPVGRDKLLLKGVTGAADKLISGWQVNGIVTLLTGFPFTPQIGANRSGNADSRAPDRPSVNPSFTGSAIVGNTTRYYDPSAYILPTVGTWGNLGRDTLTGPGFATFDFSLFKSTRISERLGLQFRAELFNILNHANFGTPNPIAFSGASYSPSAGVITSAATSRQIQFGLKLIF